MAIHLTYDEQKRPWENPHVVHWMITTMIVEVTRRGVAPTDLFHCLRRVPSKRKPSARTLDELIQWSEAEWVRCLVAGRSPSETEAVYREIAALRAELSGPEPKLWERVMIANVVIRMLEHKRAVRLAARRPATETQIAKRKEQVTRCLRRLTAAVKAIDLSRAEWKRRLERRPMPPWGW